MSRPTQKVHPCALKLLFLVTDISTVHVAVCCTACQQQEAMPVMTFSNDSRYDMSYNNCCMLFQMYSGSRSSPLALAAASHPRSQLTIAIDERSLGFWALGFSRANTCGLPAAVICSSGTAVADLLPAVVEASQSNIPLLLLTADRPYELRDTGANQTIDQVKIFGSYTRWSSDVTPPSEDLPGRVILSTIDTAVRLATAPASAGPVHLNFQFREPLAPSSATWNPDRFLQGLGAWQGSAEPYTTQVQHPAVPVTGLISLAPGPVAAQDIQPLLLALLLLLLPAAQKWYECCSFCWRLNRG